jgi:lysozyme family protein
MPETEENKQDLVDIDTSGPGAEVELEEPKEKVEVVNETTEEETKPVEATSTEEKKEEKKEASDEKQDKKEELEDYSEGVKKRIAKLTKKWREAERQREAALEYAKGVKEEQESLKTRLSTLEPNYLTAMEGRVISGLQAAQSQLAKAREAGDIAAEVEAQKMIAKLGVEEARVANLKKQSMVWNRQCNDLHCI